MRTNPNCNRRVEVALRSTEDCLHQKCQIQDYRNKSWLSVCGILSLQLKPKLGHTKLSTGLGVGHSCTMQTFLTLPYHWYIFIVFSDHCCFCCMTCAFIACIIILSWLLHVFHFQLHCPQDSHLHVCLVTCSPNFPLFLLYCFSLINNRRYSL